MPLGDDNLAARAARALAPGRGVRLEIKKNIPIAGGMAGGSADAAAALVACNALWNLGRTPEELMEIGGTLGSDVPFALLGGTAVGTGRGEHLTPVETSGTFHWVFALADGGLSTPQVYGECDRIREADRRGGRLAEPERTPRQGPRRRQRRSPGQRAGQRPPAGRHHAAPLPPPHPRRGP